MKYLKKSCAAVFVAAVFAILPAAAQQEEGMVKVDLHDIRADIAKTMNLNASEIPLTVEAPFNVAATACEMSVSDLKGEAKSGEKNGGPKCVAKKNTHALNNLVKSELKKEGTPPPKE